MQILMVTPDFFQVEYSINPFMETNGKLNTVDTALAKKQWQELKNTYEHLKCEVHTIAGVSGLPDMVFSANQSFTFRYKNEKSVLMSRMRSPYRQPEVAHFENWFSENHYKVYNLESAGSFEGNGDALTFPGLEIVVGGIGPRTDGAVYDEVEKRFGLKVLRLELIRKEFYHLDTCLSVLDVETVAICKEAFAEDSLKKIYSAFNRVITIDVDENLKYFAANCHSVNGSDVILQKGAVKFNAELLEAGFKIHEVETSEYIKSGGSVFCMKNALS